MGIISKPIAHGQALVLRKWLCGETSLIASLLTRDLGYIKVIAKGARLAGSRLMALVEPGRLVEVEFGLDPHRELQYLRDGAVQLDGLTAHPDLERTCFLLAALELVDRCRPREANRARPDTPELFAICEDYVRMLSSDTSPDPALLFFAFEWEFLAFHGLTPEVRACVSCGNELGVAPGASAWFSVSEGGALCTACRQRDGSGGRALGEDAISWLQEFSAVGLPRDYGQELTRPVRRELGATLHRFLGYHLPGYRLPAALDMLRPVKRLKET